MDLSLGYTLESLEELLKCSEAGFYFYLIGLRWNRGISSYSEYPPQPEVRSIVSDHGYLKHRPWTSNHTSSGSLLEMQNPRPPPDSLNQGLWELCARICAFTRFPDDSSVCIIVRSIALDGFSHSIGVEMMPERLNDYLRLRLAYIAHGPNPATTCLCK